MLNGLLRILAVNIDEHNPLPYENNIIFLFFIYEFNINKLIKHENNEPQYILPILCEICNVGCTFVLNYYNICYYFIVYCLYYCLYR